MTGFREAEIPEGHICPGLWDCAEDRDRIISAVSGPLMKKIFDVEYAFSRNPRQFAIFMSRATRV
ncbi:MAG: hypothetical protein R2861_13550 [Desulfobacterales bacterium]